MPADFVVYILVAAFVVALVLLAAIAVVASFGSRREKVREREGRRDGYVRDGGPWPASWDRDWGSPEDATYDRERWQS